MWQHFPVTRLNDFHGHIGDMRAGVVVQQKNSMLSSFLLNSGLESFHVEHSSVLTVWICLVQFVIPIPPYAQQFYADVFCSCTVSFVYWGLAIPRVASC